MTDGYLPSPLASLAQMRAKLADKLYLDLPVPRYDDDFKLIVRYRPLTQSDLSKASKIVDKAKGSARADAGMAANITALANACIGVYAVVGDKTYTVDAENPTQWIEFDPDSRTADWVGFDETLGAALGVEERSAKAVIRELFLTDGDIVSHAGHLTEWSGYAAQQSTEEFQGE